MHVFVEEGNDFFRMLSEVFVAVLKTPRGVLDPEQYLFLAPEKVKRLLGIFWIACPSVLKT